MAAVAAFFRALLLAIRTGPLPQLVHENRVSGHQSLQHETPGIGDHQDRIAQGCCPPGDAPCAAGSGVDWISQTCDIFHDWREGAVGAAPGGIVLAYVVTRLPQAPRVCWQRPAAAGGLWPDEGGRRTLPTKGVEGERRADGRGRPRDQRTDICS